MAKEALREDDNQNALHLLAGLENYPFNLGEGKLYGTQENDIHYVQGCAYEAMGNEELATEKFTRATRGISEPVQAIFYNDPQPDKIFYQGLTWLKLKNPKKANEIFDKLITFGKEHLDDKIKIDYFAVSLPDLLVFDQDLDLKNKIHCHYMIGLGYLGLGEIDKVRFDFQKVLDKNVNHLGVIVHLKMVDLLEKIN